MRAHTREGLAPHVTFVTFVTFIFILTKRMCVVVSLCVVLEHQYDLEYVLAGWLGRLLKLLCESPLHHTTLHHTTASDFFMVGHQH